MLAGDEIEAGLGDIELPDDFDASDFSAPPSYVLPSETCRSGRFRDRSVITRKRSDLRWLFRSALTRYFSSWALTDSNRRPLPCKGSALAN
jgi:hypothetical protein